MRAVTTRIVAGQKGFSADAHTHNHNPDEKSGPFAFLWDGLLGSVGVIMS